MLVDALCPDHFLFVFMKPCTQKSPWLHACWIVAHPRSTEKQRWWVNVLTTPPQTEKKILQHTGLWSYSTSAVFPRSCESCSSRFWNCPDNPASAGIERWDTSCSLNGTIDRVWAELEPERDRVKTSESPEPLFHRQACCYSAIHWFERP